LTEVSKQQLVLRKEECDSKELCFVSLKKLTEGHITVTHSEVGDVRVNKELYKV